MGRQALPYCSRRQAQLFLDSALCTARPSHPQDAGRADFEIPIVRGFLLHMDYDYTARDKCLHDERC